MGIVDGSISYLYSSVPLRAHLIPQSEVVPLPALLRSYRPLPELRCDDPRTPSPLVSAYTNGATSAASLMYGRLYLPHSMLEALIIKRISPEIQVQLSAVSAQSLRNGGTILGLAQYDVGRYCIEGLASSDGGLLGLRGVYNLGEESKERANTSPTAGDEGTNGEKDRIYGRFSTGGEVYYGTLNKSGGMSLGARFATLPDHLGTPLTATLTLNPLMGSVSASYAVVAGAHCSLATRLEFNVYSYESAWAVGMELWRKPLTRNILQDAEDLIGAGAGAPPPPPSASRERSFRAKMEWRLDEVTEVAVPDVITPAPPEIQTGEVRGEKEEGYTGVLKARLDQSLRIGLLWEGRAKSLLFSLGSAIDLRKPDQLFRSVGLEIQFSS